MSTEQEFRAAYLQEPFDDPDGRQVYEAARECIRRVDEYEERFPEIEHRNHVSRFARELVPRIAEVRGVDPNKLRKRIQELQR